MFTTLSGSSADGRGSGIGRVRRVLVVAGGARL